MREFKKNRVIIVLSDSELKKLRSDAERSGLTMSDYFRLLLMNCKIKEAPPAEYFTLICELRRLADSIEKLRREGSGKDDSCASSLSGLTEEIRQTEAKLWEVFAIKQESKWR